MTSHNLWNKVQEKIDASHNADPLQVKVTQAVTWQRVADLLCTGLEGGYSPWLSDFVLKAGKHADSVWYCDGPMLASGEFRIAARYDSPDKPEGSFTGRKDLNQASLRRGLQTMAAKYPRHFADFMQENDDAITGDAFLQCVIFGELIYG